METKNEIYLSVIVPIYHEAERIGVSLKRVYEYLKNQPYSWEILAVLDGPKDRTPEVVKGLISEIQNLRVIDRKENRGKGYTVREGMLAAKGQVRLFTDADNSTDISYFDKMKPLFDQGYDVVISSREPKDAPGATQEIKQAWYKRVMGDMGNLYIQILAVPGIWDTQNGFKAMTASAAEKIFSVSKIERWAFDVEMLALVKKFKYKMAIIPVHWMNDVRSNVKLSGYFKTLLEVAKIRWNLWMGKYE